MARNYKLYVIELGPTLGRALKVDEDRLGAVYVGITTVSPERRLTQHLSAVGNAGSCFKGGAAELGRDLTEQDAWLRYDLVTEIPSGPSRFQAERAERRQANKLLCRGWDVRSSHEHSKRSVRRRRRSPSPAALASETSPSVQVKKTTSD